MLGSIYVFNLQLKIIYHCILILFDEIYEKMIPNKYFYI